MSKFKYKEVIELGFERVDVSDPQFFDIYGVNYIQVTKEISRSIDKYRGYYDEIIISAEWDQNTREIRILRSTEREGDILGEIKIKSKEELLSYFNFFSKNRLKNKDHD